MINPIFRKGPPLCKTKSFRMSIASKIKCIAMRTQNAGTAFSGLASGVLSFAIFGIIHKMIEEATTATSPVAKMSNRSRDLLLNLDALKQIKLWLPEGKVNLVVVIS